MRRSVLVFAFATLAAAPALAADPATIDWSKVPAVNVTLFYPGQSSYEWLRTSSHPGAQPVSQGMASSIGVGSATAASLKRFSAKLT